MSWNNIIPWEVFTALCNENRARMCCAFANEIHLSWFRDDYLY
jgi:hypothetical protein